MNIYREDSWNITCAGRHMKALVWHGKEDVRCETVPDPRIEAAGDAIVRITSTAICGSDLHLYDGLMPTMKSGDILGHEPMGIVEEVEPGVAKLKKGDRVVIPFTISCGKCWFCEQTLFSLCDNTNPNHEQAETAMGHSPAAGFIRLRLDPPRLLYLARKRYNT